MRGGGCAGVLPVCGWSPAARVPPHCLRLRLLLLLLLLLRLLLLLLLFLPPGRRRS